MTTQQELSKLQLWLFSAAVLGCWSSTAYSQCSGFLVDIVPGPACQFVSSNAVATGIAETGEMCGLYTSCGGAGHGAIWLGQGGWISLPLGQGVAGVSPRAMNSNLLIAGRLDLIGASPPERAGLTDFGQGTTTALALLLGANSAQASRINSDGIVCGYCNNTNTGPLRACVWQRGQILALVLPFGKAAVANDISDLGAITGWMGESPAVAHVYIWRGSSVTDLGTVLPGAVGAVGTAISNQDAVCGWARKPDRQFLHVNRGFLWRDDIAQDLGVLPGLVHCLPRDLNDSNVIIGVCTNSSGSGPAFVWQNGVIRAINDLIPPIPHLDITQVWAINNSGQIAGDARLLDGSGDTVAIRLTPIPSPIGDFNCDKRVNVDDLLGVINHWGITNSVADFNHNGIVDLPDLAIVIENWTF